jgi:hypothetical protein
MWTMLPLAAHDRERARPLPLPPLRPPIRPHTLRITLPHSSPCIDTRPHRHLTRKAKGLAEGICDATRLAATLCEGAIPARARRVMQVVTLTVRPPCVRELHPSLAATAQPPCTLSPTPPLVPRLATQQTPPTRLHPWLMLRAQALAAGTRSLTLQLPADVWRHTLPEREASPGVRRFALTPIPQTTRMTNLILILTL